MKKWLAVVAVLFVPACTYAQGPKACEDLKSEIAAKLDAKGVKDYDLKIVGADEVKSETVVGTCDGGTKRIIYTKK